MAKREKDRVEVLEEQVRKLKQTIRNRDKTIRQLKSQVKSVESAWHTTEIYLKEITNGKPLSEVIKTVEAGRPLSKLNELCPKCNSRDLVKILFNKFHIITCDCGYRKKVDEEREVGKS